MGDGGLGGGASVPGGGLGGKGGDGGGDVGSGGDGGAGVETSPFVICKLVTTMFAVLVLPPPTLHE
jgi:hypothetical protein